MKRALTPGTFDPITSGHLDVIARASQLVDEVVVAVADSQKKGPLFTLEERVELVRQATAHLPNVRVEPFKGLLVDFAKELDATVVVKGLRAHHRLRVRVPNDGHELPTLPAAGNAVHHVPAAVHVPVQLHRAGDLEDGRGYPAVRAPVRLRGA